MSLPVSPDYLALALQDECRVKDITLIQRKAGDLCLPSGWLVACDPFVFPEQESFSLRLPEGAFPVILSIAQIATDQRVAFATIRLRPIAPVAWDMLTLEGQDTSELKENEHFGYGVDAGTGCFMDQAAARALNQRMTEQTDYYEAMLAEMDKSQQNTWAWMDLDLGDANLIAFSSGYGDGVYATYTGFDAQGEIACVVTDFSVLPR